MLRSLYTAATGMEAQQLKMDVIANNLANTGTTGFKRTRAEFEDLLSVTLKGAGAPSAKGGPSEPGPLQVGLGVRTGQTTRSFAQGEFVQTQNPLDIAVEGNGFFRIRRDNGEEAYTRAGNFRLDASGRIVTQHGEQLDPNMTVPPDATELTIKRDGTVTVLVPNRTEPIQLGQIELHTFVNPAGLSALGNNLFSQTAASGDPARCHPGQDGSGTLAQGMLEGANVKAAEEMIDMITTQRAYELNSKVIQTADQMLQRLTSLR